MSKQNTIRAAASMMFLQLLPSRSEVGNKMFRRNVMHYLCETHDCTVAAAATHYNYAFQDVKRGAAELVRGLGRAEGKNNGGRKKKLAVAVQITAAPMLLLGYTPSKFKIDIKALLQVPLLPLTPQLVVVPQLFTVVRSRDGAEVGTGLTQDEALAMIHRAAAGKKAKLQIKE